jgi:DNA primase
MPGIDFNRVRSSISLAQVLELLHFVPQRSAAIQLRGPCPVHRDKHSNSRSFSVNLTRNQYRCFQCGSAGGQLELWAQVKHLTVYDAAIDLCRTLGVDTPWIHRW